MVLPRRLPHPTPQLTTEITGQKLSSPGFLPGWLHPPPQGHSPHPSPTGSQEAQPRQPLTACVVQPDQAVEEIVEVELEALVCVSQDDQLQEVMVQLEACGGGEETRSPGPLRGHLRGTPRQQVGSLSSA